MIFSSIHANDDLKRYPIAIQKAIEYAKTTDFAGLEDGKHEIDGDQMFVNLFHLTSKPKEETHPDVRIDVIAVSNDGRLNEHVRAPPQAWRRGP